MSSKWVSGLVPRKRQRKTEKTCDTPTPSPALASPVATGCQVTSYTNTAVLLGRRLELARPLVGHVPAAADGVASIMIPAPSSVHVGACDANVGAGAGVSGAGVPSALQPKATWTAGVAQVSAWPDAPRRTKSPWKDLLPPLQGGTPTRALPEPASINASIHPAAARTAWSSSPLAAVAIDAMVTAESAAAISRNFSKESVVSGACRARAELSCENCVAQARQPC